VLVLKRYKAGLTISVQGYKWQKAPDPCSHWYPGTRPFESLEVNALATYITHRIGGRGKSVAFLDLRAYGQIRTSICIWIALRFTRATVSAPYSYSCQIYPPDAEDLIEAALGAAQAGFKIHGRQFSTGRLCETMYRYINLLLTLVECTKFGLFSAPGDVIDWTYGYQGIKYSYSLHLRDTGTYGYSVPTGCVCLSFILSLELY